MTTRGISRFALFDTLECLGGKPLVQGAFIDASAATTQRSQTQREAVTLTMPRTAEAAGYVHEGQILQRWRSDTNSTEWPVEAVKFTAGEDATVSITARALKYRLGDYGYVTQAGVTPQDGLPILTYSVSGTATELVDQFLTDRDPSDTLASRLSWVSTGTIEPTAIITLDVDRWNTQQFLDGIVAALESVNVLAEWDLVRNGSTDYQIQIINTPLAT